MASDSFTGTNGTALTTHDANWSLCADDDFGRIYGNGVSYGAWSEGCYRYAGSNGNESIITLKAGANSGSAAKVGPAVRMGSTTSGYHLLLGSISGSNYTYLHVRKNRNWLSRFSGTWSINSDHVVRIVASGTGSTVTINCYVDGIFVGSCDDSSTPYISGLSGIYLMGDGSNDYAFGDDWSDGAISSKSLIPNNMMQHYLVR